MAKIDKKYHKLLNYILDNGRWQDDPNREGVKRLNIPKYTFEYDLRKGFPAVTTKKLFWKGVVGELLWFLRGDTNIKYLVDNGINIWNKDAYNYYLKKCKEWNKLNKLTVWHKHSINPLSFEDFIEAIKNGNINIGNNGYTLGDLDRVYGAQWRNWNEGNWDNYEDGRDSIHDFKGIDQISNLIKNLKEKPLATDHIVTACNPAELNNMALPPCHKGFQLMVYELTHEERYDIWFKNNYETGFEYNSSEQVDFEDSYWIETPKYGFDLVWEQRSVDTFLGLPFNIASYALLAHIIGKIVNMIPGKIYGDLRNVHIYDNAIEGVKEQLSRDVNKYDNCRLVIKDRPEYNRLGGRSLSCSLDNFLSNLEISDFTLNNYKSYPEIKVKMLSRDE